MNREKAYSIISKHVFIAHLKYESNKDIVILATRWTKPNKKRKNSLACHRLVLMNCTKLMTHKFTR